MNRLLGTVVAAVVLAGCGSDISYWKITKSEVAYGSECSDATSFRSGVQAPSMAPNKYLTYRKDAGGKTATAMSCKTTDPSSCTERVPAMVFALSGDTGTYSDPATKQPLGTTKCQMQSVNTWSFTEKGSALDGKVDIVFDLVDDPTDCQAYEDLLKAGAPNKKGVKGCVVTLSYSGVRD